MRRALTVWIGRLILPRFTPEATPLLLDDLAEVHQTISERIDSWRERIEKQARQTGLQEGLQQGQADALLRLLGRRFGPLHTDIAARVRAASVEQIEQWADRALDAPGLPEVFSGH